jgi:hypothetical protein
MPAINLPRLRKQVNELAPYCSEPEIFLRKLKDLFDYYGDRSLRPSQVAARPTAIPAFNVPPPVLRQVVGEITPYATRTPHLILDLSRELWKYGWFEQRLLACELLGKIPPSQAEEIVRLAEEWCQENFEEALLTAIAELSLAPLHVERHELLLAKAQEWLAAPESKQDIKPALPAAVLVNLQKLGLRALVPLATNQGYENLPMIYKTLKPILQSPSKVLRPDVLDLLRSLSRRSPQETAFYLRGLHKESPSATLTWLIRRSLNTFPEDLRYSLRELIKSGKTPPN